MKGKGISDSSLARMAGNIAAGMVQGQQPHDLHQAIVAERERCAQIADQWANSKSCEQHDTNPCCHVRTGAGIAAAIRATPDGEK